MTSATADPFATTAALDFRARLRQWFVDELPAGWGTESFASPADEPAEVAFLRDWQRKLSEHGYAGLSWPTEYGGAGAGIVEQVIFAEERDRVRAPLDIGIVGTQMVGPMLIAHGTEAQKQRYLPRILNAEELWCQGFSEPEAGSDLASLRTRARRVDGGWQLDGQKVWTSRAQYAEQMIVLARTNPDASPHRGISAFIVAMDTPGLVIRPIQQINGSTEFCEVFLTEAVVADDALVGAVDDGWRVALSTLSFERLATTRAFEMRRLVCELAAAHREIWGADELSPLAAEIVEHVLDAHACGVTFRRMATVIARSGDVGVDASATKLATTELGQRIVASAMSSLPGAALDGGVEPRVGGPVSWPLEFVNGVKNTIAAGTSQIQRNIIGERVLGLPKSASRPSQSSADPRDRPFVDLALDEDQATYVDTVRRALRKVFPIERAIAAAEGDDVAGDDVWSTLVELGVPGLGDGADSGGLDLLGLAVAEGGYALLPGALLGHAIAHRVVQRAVADGATVAWADDAAAGTRRLTVALTDETSAVSVDPNGRVHGALRSVVDADAADAVITLAARGDEPVVIAVPISHDGVAVTPHESIDPSRHLFSVAFTDVAVGDGELLAAGGAAVSLWAAARRDAALLVAFDSIGSARRAVDDAIAYAGERQQFGAPIGSFQAIKHLLVDAHVAVEDARSAVLHAATAGDEFAVSAAKVLAARAHNVAAAKSLQVLGGIGFTREVAGHLYLKRARVNEHFGGSPDEHRRRAAAHVDQVIGAWSNLTPN